MNEAFVVGDVIVEYESNRIIVCVCVCESWMIRRNQQVGVV